MEGNGDMEEGGLHGGVGGTIWAEVKRQISLVGPLIFANFLLFSLQVVSVMFVGHLGQLALASASLATSFASVTALSFLQGMSSALDTFCGQAYGAKQYHMLGVYKQRAMVVLLHLCIPLALFSSFAEQILLAMKQDATIAKEAGSYARWLIPCIPAYALLQCHMKFLQTQKIVLPMMITTGIIALIHLPVCWALVFKSGLGNKGAALANDISYWLNVILLAIYIRTSQSCKKTWTGFSLEALSGIMNYVKLAVPSTMMICLEFWSFETLVLISGLLPRPKLETSVLSICLNTSATMFMIGLGMGTAVSVRVANELGAGCPRAARSAVFVGLSMALVTSSTIAVILISMRHVWGKLYSKDADVINYVARMMPILSASTFINGMSCVFSGTVRGSGRQRVGAFVNLGAYYLVGIPSGVIMAFPFHFHGKGIWLGITLALLVQLISLMVITLCTDWGKEANKAKDRVSNGNGITARDEDRVSNGNGITSRGEVVDYQLCD